MEYKVTDATTGNTFMADENDSLFFAMRRKHEGPITYGCGGGGCGACKIEILDGDFEIFKKMSRAHVSEQEQDSGIVLACCVKPKSNITLKKFSQK